MTSIPVSEQKKPHRAVFSGIALAVAIVSCAGLANFDHPERALGFALPVGLIAGIIVARPKRDE